MTIEPISKNDVIRVQRLAHLTWPDTFKDILSSEQIDYMLNWMYSLDTLTKQLKEGHRFYVLTKDAEDIGFIGLQLKHPTKMAAKLHKIYILPSAQGIGAGKLLMEKAEEIARKEGKAEYLLLNVNRFNKATEFYKKIGFEIIREEDIDIGNGYLMEDYVMKKYLSFC